MSEEQTPQEANEAYRNELLAQQRVFAEQIHAYEQLQASGAWATLCSLLEAQEEMRIGEVLLVPLGSADAVYRQEFMKGEIAALRLVRKLPQLSVEGLRENNQRLSEELENLNDD